MAAPAPTTRTVPVPGKKPGSGHRTLIVFALDPDIMFWEKSVKPSGMDGGDPIDTTTMHNNVVRTKAPRKLVDNTDITATVTYDPAVFPLIRALLNKETTVTTAWWDGSSYAQYGFLRTFEPGDVAEDGQPEATITVTVTNQDPTTGAEQEGVYTAPPAPPPLMGPGPGTQGATGQEAPQQALAQQLGPEPKPQGGQEQPQGQQPGSDPGTRIAALEEKMDKLLAVLQQAS